jgi:hypothetical protein
MSFSALPQPSEVPARPQTGATAERAPVSLGKADAAVKAAAVRDLRLDFFRGVALFLIFIDHIPGNILSYFTIQSTGFSDAAEVFVFVSGYTAALVYGRAMLKQGPIVATAKIYYRVWQIYVAHIFVFLIYLAFVSFHTVNFADQMFGKELGAAKFFSEPYIAVMRVLELRFQPSFLDILPLYITLLASFPLVLMLLRQHVLAALIPSLALYLAAQVFELNLHGYPGFRPWFFSPFAWQLLFVIGAACGFPRPTGPWIDARLLDRLLVPAAAIALVAAVVRLTWTVHNFWDAVPALFIGELWPVNKTALSPIRLVNFLALAIVVVRFTSADAAFLRWPVLRPIIRCGQNSLQIFCLGILLSVIGQFLQMQWGGSLAAQLAISTAGILAMIGTAQMIVWYKALDRATA